jgi:hypothetical protein
MRAQTERVHALTAARNFLACGGRFFDDFGRDRDFVKRFPFSAKTWSVSARIAGKPGLFTDKMLKTT